MFRQDLIENMLDYYTLYLYKSHRIHQNTFIIFDIFFKLDFVENILACYN